MITLNGFLRLFISGTPSVPSSSTLTVKIYYSSGVKPPFSLASSMDRHLFAKGTAFFAEATEVLNSLILLEEEAYKEENSSTWYFSLVSIILASMASFLADLLTSH